MSKVFAKIVEASDGYQVLAIVQRSEDEDVVELRTITNSTDGLKVEFALSFPDDSDQSWTKADKALAEFDVARADTVRQIYTDMIAEHGALTD